MTKLFSSKVSVPIHFPLKSFSIPLPCFIFFIIHLIPQKYHHKGLLLKLLAYLNTHNSLLPSSALVPLAVRGTALLWTSRILLLKEPGMVLLFETTELLLEGVLKVSNNRVEDWLKFLIYLEHEWLKLWNDFGIITIVTIECFPRTNNCAKGFSCIISFNLGLNIRKHRQ